eukprot:TRINITY_DN10538_c0_g2_i1.p1 TRINITY_DN10538_c0_g2~~TRINITY_DN10538_c0_g2_i1.p1  ORF type:complete len:495 (+),score=141.72 TRINITY_DN10538_c0_g2_i1:556-2040(+)
MDEKAQQASQAPPSKRVVSDIHRQPLADATHKTPLAKTERRRCTQHGNAQVPSVDITARFEQSLPMQPSPSKQHGHYGRLPSKARARVPAVQLLHSSPSITPAANEGGAITVVKRYQPSSTAVSPASVAKRPRANLSAIFAGMQTKKPAMLAGVDEELDHIDDDGIMPLESDDDEDGSEDTGDKQIVIKPTTGLPSPLSKVQSIKSRFAWSNLQPTGRLGPHVLSQDSETQAQVFIKAVALTSNGLPQQALREIANLRSLHHPHIMPLLAVRSNLCVYELAMPYVRQTLLDVIAQERVAEGVVHPEWHGKCAAMMVQLLSAVDHVHSCGMVHGNIQPQHIRVTSSRRLLLTGFQDAKLGLVPLAQETQRDYQSMDLLLGNGYVTMEADVWACCAIYLHMLAGRSVFHEDSAIGQLMIMMSVMGTPTEQTWPGVSNLPHYQSQFPRFAKREWRHTLQTSLSEDQRMLLDMVMVCDPAKRPTARRCKQLFEKLPQA